MAKSKLIKANEKVEAVVTDGYQKVEDHVVKGYEKIEHAFVERYLTHENETVEEAKQRLNQEKADRQANKEHNHP